MEKSHSASCVKESNAHSSQRRPDTLGLRSSPIAIFVALLLIDAAISYYDTLYEVRCLTGYRCDQIGHFTFAFSNIFTSGMVLYTSVSVYRSVKHSAHVVSMLTMIFLLFVDISMLSDIHTILVDFARQI
jgi:hypothetical protein